MKKKQTCGSKNRNLTEMLKTLKHAIHNIQFGITQVHFVLVTVRKN